MRLFLAFLLPAFQPQPSFKFKGTALAENGQGRFGATPLGNGSFMSASSGSCARSRSSYLGFGPQTAAQCSPATNR
jgi:hypothetical protein